MFKFIKNENIETKITEEYILSLENDLQIKFPKILRDYYLKYNGAEIEECKLIIQMGAYNINCYVTEILTLKYGKYNFEHEAKYIRDIENIPNEFIPFAIDEGSDRFCWDYSTGKVYYVRMDEENPILICDSVEQFFDILTDCVKNENGCTLDGKEDFNYSSSTPIGTEKNNLKEESEVKKILTFNSKNKPLILLFVLTIASLILIPFTDSLSLLLTGAFAIYTLILLGIHITNRIKSINVVNKYGFDELKKELLSNNTIKVEGINTYLTEKYIISNHQKVVIIEYKDISWIYPTRIRGRNSITAHISAYLANRMTGTPLRAHLKNGKSLISAITNNRKQVQIIFNRIHQKNNQVLIGYNKDNMKKYEKVCPKYKNKKIWGILLVIALVIIAILIQKI